MNGDEFVHQIKQAAMQQSQEHRPFVYAHVASYDPKLHRVRCIIASMRDTAGNAVLTSWVPLSSAWSGNGFGIQVAPQGGATAENPTKGEPVLLQLVERNYGVIVAASMIFNEVNSAPFPELKPGEFGIKHSTGSLLQFNTDGDVLVTAHRDLVATANRDAIVNAPSGKVTITASSEIDLTAPTVKVDGDLNVTGDITWPKGMLSGGGATIDGNLTATGDVHAGEGGSDRIGLRTHTHQSATAGQQTSAPTANT